MYSERENSEVTDIFKKCYDFIRAAEARKQGLYPFFRPLQASRGPAMVAGWGKGGGYRLVFGGVQVASRPARPPR